MIDYGEPTMSRSMLVLAATAGMMIQALPSSAQAADLGVAPQAVAPASCPPCGCLTVSYVYHPELRSTYGTGFDPRNFDGTQPYYYFGPVRAYPRYFVDGVPVPHQCR
jgi:hypothetical protein